MLTRARILLKADQADGGPALDDAAIADDLEVGLRTISRVRERFVERGFEDCLRRKKQDRPSRVRTLDGAAEAKLIALACSDPPADRRAPRMTPSSRVSSGGVPPSPARGPGSRQRRTAGRAT